MNGGWRRPVLLAGACSAAFVAVVLAAYFVPVIRWADGWAIEGFMGVRAPWLTSVSSFMVHLGDPGPFALGTVAIALVALKRGRPRHALAAIALLAGANIATQVLKLLLQHDRPHAFLDVAEISSTAFPSGHATASMSLALAAVLVAPVALRPLVAVAGALFALAVSESILLLGWHFASDVVGGFLVAATAALLVLAALRAADERWPERTGREAARRALGTKAFSASVAAVAGLVSLILVALALPVGPDALAYMDRHTTAVAGALGVAAMAAALPAALTALSVRRS
jgi:membrane-associated phospholipid phosphatase